MVEQAGLSTCIQVADLLPLRVWLLLETKQSKTKQNKIKQNKTTQHKTMQKQNKTTQNKTTQKKQNKTKHNKTKKEPYLYLKLSKPLLG